MSVGSDGLKKKKVEVSAMWDKVRLCVCVFVCVCLCLLEGNVLHIK